MKYSFLEMLLSDRAQWVRRISKQFWAKAKGGTWVKFTDDEIHIFRMNGFDIATDDLADQVEDWRSK